MTNLKSDNLKPLMIIPSAGWGRSVGSPISKEMLPGPDGNPMISYSLSLAKEFNFDVLVVTREEKTNLIEYLKKEGVSFLLVEPTKEWPETVLKSSQFWREKNLICLPDTVFSPPNILQQIKAELDLFDFVFAGFKTSKQHNWGMISIKNTNEIIISEKPGNPLPEAFAWGLFGFKKEFAYKSLESMLESCTDHQWKNLNLKAKIVSLAKFEDLTRNASNNENRPL